MSLLIKALQKAEQSKENGGAADKPAFSTDLTLELAPHHAGDHDASLAEEGGFTEPMHVAPAAAPVVAATATSAPTANTIPEHVVERAAAANVFHAKTDAVSDPGGRRAFWLGLTGLALLLLLGGGFYVYLETLQPPEIVAVRPPQPIKPAEPAATPAPPPVQETPAEPAVTAAAPVAPVAEEPAEPKPAPVEPVKPAVSTSALAAPAEKPVKKPTPEQESVKVTKSRKAEPVTNATAMAAYQAFMAGDDAAAGRLYRQLLQAEPRNIDALLGMAAVAARQDNTDEAAAQYARALELEPRNGVAQAGLIALMSQADPVAAESRLKSLLAQQPDAAYLHGALGGVYAEQGQWSNAQQSYFQAFRLDPASAEHAFNLAISLDQLAKPDLALEYYQRTRDLLPKQGGSIDRTQLESRISQLRSALGK